MIVWDNIQEMLDTVDKYTRYVILRNGTRPLENDFLFSGEDIDILCKNLKEFVKLTGAKHFKRSLTNMHTFYVLVGDIKIYLDLYFPGDGYYDKKWELEMLENRLGLGNGIYILNDENQFYSLVYHALYHKGQISTKHLNLIVQYNPGIWDGKTETLPGILESFMIRHGYWFIVSYASDNNKFHGISNKHIHIMLQYRVIRLAKKVKQLLGGDCVKCNNSVTFKDGFGSVAYA